METHSHGSYMIGRGLYNSYFFVYGFCGLTFNIGAHDMFYILFHFGLIESLSYGHYCGSFTKVCYHGHVKLHLHDFCVQFPY
jgi:hypothetical protein